MLDLDRLLKLDAAQVAQMIDNHPESWDQIRGHLEKASRVKERLEVALAVIEGEYSLDGLIDIVGQREIRRLRLTGLGEQATALAERLRTEIERFRL